MASWVEKAKQAVGLSQPEEEAPSSGLLQHLDEASTLSRTQVDTLLNWQAKLINTWQGSTVIRDLMWADEICSTACEGFHYLLFKVDQVF